MNLELTPDEAAFRDEVRRWLEANVPRSPRPHDGPEARAFDLEWQRRQYEAGWAGISWPAEYGGLGLSLTKQLIWYEEYARAGGPYVGVNFVGLNHGGPTLIAWGDEAQKAYHLPRILRGEAVWCQGFSEPEAGSDLASLRTRAVVDGDHLVVNGQKVWTSYAHLADFQELLVRTDPDAPRHKGITWVICDMHSPGITVRPIATIDGGHEFCEVFYDDVRIPLANVVGGLNQGWRVAMSTLGFERGTAFAAQQVQLSHQIDRLVDAAAARPGPLGQASALDDDEIRAELAAARAACDAVRAMTYLSASRNARTALPGPEGSMLRLYFSELAQRVSRLAMDILGPDGLRLTGFDDGFTRRYLYSYAETIGGGTAEIQREVIGERVLGLPRGR